MSTAAKATSAATPEKFIPVSKFALIEKLIERENYPEDDEKSLKAHRKFFNCLINWRHRQFRQRLNRVKEYYLPFSPDRDTKRILEYDTQERLQMQDTLTFELAQLLTKANYEEITHDKLTEILSRKSPHGLSVSVDRSEFDEILLFSRGSSTETYQRRSPRSLYLKKETVIVPVFQRLFLLLKLKPKEKRIEDIKKKRGVSEEKAQQILKKYRARLPKSISGEHIYLKLFKNIPQADLEMLFPNTRVQLNLYDKLKLGVTAGGGTVGSVTATVTKVTAAANPLAAAGALLGLAGVVTRQVTKYFSQRTKYMMLLAQKLYFHNLANNRGVLTLMFDRAEEEDIKEALILYSFLRQNPTHKKNITEIKQQVEDYFLQNFNIIFDYDIKEPLASLKNDGIITENNEGLLQVLPPEKATQLIEKKWRSLLCRQIDNESDTLEEDDGI